MKILKYFLFAFYGLLCLKIIDGYRILGIFPTRCKSHWAIGHSVMKTLVEAGHEVYVVSPFPLKSPMINYNDIFLDYGEKAIELNMFDTVDWSPIQMFTFLSDVDEFMSNFILSNPNFQQVMQKKIKFDALIIEIFGMEALYGLGGHLNIPVIGLSTFGTSKWTNDLTKTPMEYSYVPHNFLKYSEKMNFIERTMNMLVSQYENIFMEFVHYGRQREIYDQFFGSNSASFEEQMKNVSLVLINNHFISSSIRPLVPNMIEIGGIHVNPTVNSLTEDIQHFLDSATEGAIVFSMGSILQGVKWPVDKREAFIRAFSELKQKVLWKYENDTMPNKPDNVMISSWIPQRDVLAHENIKLFITHGGLLGTTEAIYEGVPVLGIPIYADQQMNMQRADNMGIGIAIDYNNFDEELISKNIEEILTNSKFQKNAKLLSKLYKDRPMSPQKSVTYWIEYVIRNNGAVHLKSAAHDLNFFQLHLLDSYGLIVVVLYMCFYSVKKIICWMFMTRKVEDKKVKMS